MQEEKSQQTDTNIIKKQDNSKSYLILLSVVSAIVFVFISISSILWIYSSRADNEDDIEQNSAVDQNENTDEDTNSSSSTEQEFTRFGLATDTSNSLIELRKVLSGGPGKDGIPAINNPKFIKPDEVNNNVNDDTRGILLELDGEVRFYPYNVLVWHEIVNDEIGDNKLSITFCPLCGSAIVYNRVVNGEELQFGVSGLLYESNLLMYDTKTESLWSQIEGRAVIGEFTETELEIVPIQLLEFEEARDRFPQMQVLSDDTGFSRDYSYYPYGDYDTNDNLYFNVTYRDQRLQIKEIMVATVYNDQPLAFVFSKLRDEGEATLETDNGDTITARYQDEELVLLDPNGEELPNFFTQWFSWANHNLPEGVNPDTNGIVWGL